MGALALHVSVANRVAIELYRREGFSVRARLHQFQIRHLLRTVHPLQGFD